MPMKKQFWITVCLLGLMIIYLRYFGSVTAVNLPNAFVDFPTRINSFVMKSADDLDEAVIQELGVDEYINRIYRDEEGDELSLYLGYYKEQTEGAMIHSPKHCMPGSGWVPVENDVVSIASPETGRTYRLNRVLLQKGMAKIIMHYWYQGRNRIVANEYLDRLYLIMDSIVQRRSDGALVRVIGPWDATGDLEKKQENFIQSLFPVLQQHLSP